MSTQDEMVRAEAGSQQLTINWFVVEGACATQVASYRFAVDNYYMHVYKFKHMLIIMTTIIKGVRAVILIDHFYTVV
jgi:hypothetical protein